MYYKDLLVHADSRISMSMTRYSHKVSFCGYSPVFSRIGGTIASVPDVMRFSILKNVFQLNKRNGV